MDNVYELWIKKTIKVKEFDEYYQHNNSYCVLRKSKDGIVIGFMVANPCVNGVLKFKAGRYPESCAPLTDDEVLQVDAYRRSFNIYPFPCVDIKV